VLFTTLGSDSNPEDFQPAPDGRFVIQASRPLIKMVIYNKGFTNVNKKILCHEISFFIFLRGETGT
jgi:hypothetical protein